MTQQVTTINTIAPLTNVSHCMATLQRAIGRDPNLPGMVVFHGPSGYGKSYAAAYMVNKLNAVYVECKSTWTKKALLTEILFNMEIPPEKTIYAMTKQIQKHLLDTGRPLIIDELDHLVEKKAVEIIRDIYEDSKAPILLIGEEHLPAKLERWERFHGRILDWKKAEPVSLEDVAHLVHLYYPGLQVEEELLIKVHDLAKGSIRRVCVNLSRINEEAKRSGLKEIGLAEWGSRALYTGSAPTRRS